MAANDPLPVEACLPELLAALDCGNRAVLVAAPGAGKTTRVPTALAAAPWCEGKVLVMEPRRLPARSAAAHVAALAGEPVGESVGYRVRFEQRTSARTRVEFVTEGVFSGGIVGDPALSGIAAVIFDEFHERNLEGDFGLALALETQAALRPDLRILVMSATLEGERLADYMGGAPVISSSGRAWPVEIRYAPPRAGETLPAAMARTALATAAGRRGSVLCFLPGQREIRMTQERLTGFLPADVGLFALHGSLDPGAQDAAIRPPAPGERKLILSTAIAETSLTIEGVSVVIDSGLRRGPRFEPSTGLTRLETYRAARASVDQRAGRAGRTGPGLAIRLWAEPQNAALPQYERPEILEAELSDLVLALAAWGVTTREGLAWLDPPPVPAWTAAVSVLRAMGAVDDDGRITRHGRRLRRIPLAPALAAMTVAAAEHSQAETAAMLGLLVTEQGLGGPSPDLAVRLERLAKPHSWRERNAVQMAARIARSLKAGCRPPVSAGGLLSLAFPDRIARAGAERGVFQTAGGRAGRLAESENLAGAPWLVIADMQGRASGARIVAAAGIGETEIGLLHSDRFICDKRLEYDEKLGLFRNVATRSLGALVLARSVGTATPGETLQRAIIDLVRERGLSLLPFAGRPARFRARLAFLHRQIGEPWPAMGDAALAEALDDWLAPFLGSVRGPGEVGAATLVDALAYRLDRAGVSSAEADRLAPPVFRTPAGSEIGIDYRENAAVVAVRPQEIFGMTTHPAIVDGSIPLTFELLSPARRPMQVTTDIPGFWKGSWAEVAREMKGRYPKHYWPERPETAQPTAGVKPRGASSRHG